MQDNLIHASTLLHDVQMQEIFPDGKTFVDCVPQLPLHEIEARYHCQKEEPGFNLEAFVKEHFKLPAKIGSAYASNSGNTVSEHIEALWPVLTRDREPAHGSLIELPCSYIVPGGRFGEIYYWDSYFTMLGLQASGRYAMIENMVKNFAHLVERFGYIPNGNRDYFLGRSQPPFFSLMISLLEEIKGPETGTAYLSVLQTEYDFWMKGADYLDTGTTQLNHVVLMPGGEILNRYWDAHDTPRPESYREDVELAASSTQKPADIYRHLRAGAESGWDYSCRWFGSSGSFASIHTTDIVPVDLNCLLLHLEEKLAALYTQTGDQLAAQLFTEAAGKRKAAIDKYCWNEAEGFYFDFDTTSGGQQPVFSLAAMYPLFFKVATAAQASKIAAVIETKFLHAGGLITTLNNTGQQWDAPNGWAPLHWLSVIGLENYGLSSLATNIAGRWIKLCTAVFGRTGKLMEKYNVVDTELEAGGGEYPGQDGFGWTNGVLLALLNQYGNA